MSRHVVELITEEPSPAARAPEGATAPVRHGPRTTAHVADAETAGSDA